MPKLAIPSPVFSQTSCLLCTIIHLSRYLPAAYNGPGLSFCFLFLFFIWQLEIGEKPALTHTRVNQFSSGHPSFSFRFLLFFFFTKYSPSLRGSVNQSGNILWSVRTSNKFDCRACCVYGNDSLSVYKVRYICLISIKMEDKVPAFKSSQEAVAFYKNLAADYKRRLSETQQELEEFQEGSRDLEHELEAQLEQAESKNKELQAANQQLKLECERLQAKLNTCQTDSSSTIASLQDELQQLRLVKEDLQIYIRKLEQKNDDFERATRASLMSLEDFETRLNQAIERNAFLENELDEKENMAVLIQRLKDESRDLKQELSIHDTKNEMVPQSPTKKIDSIIDSNKLVSEVDNRNRLRRSNTRSSFMSNAGSTNVPHSALNFVGDLLKKVGVLESKLQSCRDCIKENSDHIGEKRASSALTNSSRVRHINGTPLSNPKDFIPLTA